MASIFRSALIALAALSLLGAASAPEQEPAGGSEPRPDVTSEGPAVDSAPRPPASDVPAIETRMVALARFTSAIENLEPVDAVTFISNDVPQIHFFTDLRHLEGETITHRWKLGQKVMAEVPFEVRGPRWRVWSSKQLQQEWLGTWTVEVVKSDGEVLAAESFSYQPRP